MIFIYILEDTLNQLLYQSQTRHQIHQRYFLPPVSHQRILIQLSAKKFILISLKVFVNTS